jgi:hypothetical protein
MIPFNLKTVLTPKRDPSNKINVAGCMSDRITGFVTRFTMGMSAYVINVSDLESGNRDFGGHE